MKKIKQIADEIGVSKQAVYKRVRGALHTDIVPYVHTVNGVLYVDEIGESLIVSAFSKDTPHTRIVYGSAYESHTADASTDAVQVLIEQLSIKDKLIEKQQQSIQELTAALENTTASLHAAQALHAGTMQRQLTDGTGDLVEPDPSGGIIARLFKKKRGKKEQ